MFTVDTADGQGEQNEARASRMTLVMAQQYPAAFTSVRTESVDLAAEVIADLYHWADGEGVDIDHAMARGRRRYETEVAAERAQVEDAAGIRLAVCRRGCGGGVDEMLRWCDTCARCRVDDDPMPRTWRVVIAGQERHDGEAPYGYLVTATNATEARLIASMSMIADQGHGDMEVKEVAEGTPDPCEGFNDLRDLDLDQLGEKLAKLTR